MGIRFASGDSGGGIASARDAIVVVSGLESHVAIFAWEGGGACDDSISAFAFGGDLDVLASGRRSAWGVGIGGVARNAVGIANDLTVGSAAASATFAEEVGKGGVR